MEREEFDGASLSVAFDGLTSLQYLNLNFCPLFPKTEINQLIRQNQATLTEVYIPLNSFNLTCLSSYPKPTLSVTLEVFAHASS